MTLRLLSAFAVMAVCAFAAAPEEGLLIVQKTVHSPMPGMWFPDGRAILAQGLNFTVQITARNIGKRCEP